MGSFQDWVCVLLAAWLFVAIIGWLVCGAKWSEMHGEARESRQRMRDWEHLCDDLRRQIRARDEEIRDHRRATARLQTRLDAVSLAASVGPGHWPVAESE